MPAEGCSTGRAFGLLCQVAGAYSRSWSYREDSLLAIYKKMAEASVNTPKEDLKSLLRGATFLVVRAIKDIVSSVSLAFGARGAGHRLRARLCPHCSSPGIPPGLEMGTKRPRSVS